MSLLFDIISKSPQPLSLVMRSTNRAAMWSRIAVGTLACSLVTLLLADQFTTALLLYVSVVLSVSSVLLSTIATGSHGSAYLDSRRAMKTSKPYVRVDLHRRVLSGLMLSWAGHSLAMAAVPVAGLACSLPALWIPVISAFAGCFYIARYANTTKQMIARVGADCERETYEVRM